MSRVLSDTALRRSAALTLVALATTFAACGDDESKNSPTASTPAASTTPAATSEPATAPSSKDAEKNEEPKASAKSAPSAPSASSAAPTPAGKSLDKEIQHIRSALKTAGYKLQPTVASSATNGTIRLEGATIFVFADEGSAKAAEKQIKETYKKSGDKVAVSRDGTHVFIVRPQGDLQAGAALKKLQAAAAA